MPLRPPIVLLQDLRAAFDILENTSCLITSITTVRAGSQFTIGCSREVMQVKCLTKGNKNRVHMWLVEYDIP